MYKSFIFFSLFWATVWGFPTQETSSHFLTKTFLVDLTNLKDWLSDLQFDLQFRVTEMKENKVSQEVEPPGGEVNRNHQLPLSLEA